MASETSDFDSMSVVECVGFPVENLTEDQKSKIEAQLECFQEGDVVAFKCFGNIDATSDEDVPSGTAALFSTDATVQPDAIPDSMFAVLCVSKIHERQDMPGGYTDAYFMDPKKQEALSKVVPQYVASPARLSIRDPRDNSEFDYWDSELGGVGSQISIVSRLRRNNRDKDYFLLAKGTAPVAVEEFKKQLRKKKPTFGMIVSDPEWRSKIQYLHNVALRNVSVNMYAVAEALGVPIVNGDDCMAYRKNDHQAFRAMAKPEWVQQISSIRPTFWKGGKPVVAVYHDVVPQEDCQALMDGNFFVMGSPYDGVTVFSLTSNPEVFGVPSTTGRTKATNKLSEMDASSIKSRAKGMMWEDNDTYTNHVDLHPEAFHPVGNKIKNVMKCAGWNPEHHIGVMVPLVTKLWNPEKKRP